MPFNPEHFRRRFPGRPLPDLRFRPERERWAVARRLAARFGLGAGGTGDSPVWEPFDAAVMLEAAAAGPADADAFELMPLFDACDVAPRPVVYLDWYSG